MKKKLAGVVAGWVYVEARPIVYHTVRGMKSFGFPFTAYSTQKPTFKARTYTISDLHAMDLVTWRSFQ